MADEVAEEGAKITAPDAIDQAVVALVQYSSDCTAALCSNTAIAQSHVECYISDLSGFSQQAVESWKYDLGETQESRLSLDTVLVPTGL